MSNLVRRFFSGRVDEARAEYQQRGYHLFRAGFPPEQTAAVADLVRRSIPTYKGLIRRGNGKLEVNQHYPDTSCIRNPPANIHFSAPAGLEALYDAIRALITSPALAERLQRLDDEQHYTIHQTLLFMSTPTTELHIDSFSLDTVPHGYAHTIWIPLQDMDASSGVPGIIPWPRGKLLTEAELGLAADGPPGERYHPYQQALARKFFAASPEVIMPLVRSGDFIVWSSLTPHLTLPSQPWPKERLALQVLIRPTCCTWGTFFTQPSKWTIDRAVKVSERFTFLEV